MDAGEQTVDPEPMGRRVEVVPAPGKHRKDVEDCQVGSTIQNATQKLRKSLRGINILLFPQDFALGHGRCPQAPPHQRQWPQQTGMAVSGTQKKEV